MRIDDVINALKLALGSNDVGPLSGNVYTNGWTALVHEDLLIRGFRLIPTGPCIVVEYDVSVFSYGSTRDVQAYGFLMYVKHIMEQIFECVPFLCAPSEACFRFTIVGFKSSGGLNGDRGSEECAQISMS